MAKAMDERLNDKGSNQVTNGNVIRWLLLHQIRG